MPLKVKPEILTIAPYKPGSSKAEAGARTVIKLSSNESPLKASPKAKAAYLERADELFRYPEGSALHLRTAIEEVTGLDKERIICGAGSDEIIAFLCHAYAGPGDEVLYSQHGFLMYPIYAKIAGATPVTAAETNLRSNVEALLSKVTSKTRILFLANPNNPTGSYISKEELHYLREKLPENILLVIDDAYAEYVDRADYSAGLELVDKYDNVVVTRTFSKIYGLASLRIGWAYCPEAIIDVLSRVRGPFNVSDPAIHAAAAAIKDTEFTAKAKAHNLTWMKYLQDEFTKLGLKPYDSVGNFVLVEFNNSRKTANEANDYLLKQGVIGRKVAAYGLGNCLRFTVGLEEENRLLVQELAAFLRA